MSPAIEEMKTIDAPSSSRGSASRQQSTGPRRLAASVASQAAVLTPASRPAPTPMPTFSTIPSRPPRPECASFTMRPTWASSVMSAAIGMASPPSPRIRSTVALALAASRSATPTLAPSRAKSTHMARPLPIGSVAASKVCCPPPTTRMRRPRSRPRPGASPRDSALGGRTLRVVSAMVASRVLA